MSNGPPRAPGELAEIEAIIRRHVWARVNGDAAQILGLGAAAAEIAALRAPQGDGAEVMRLLVQVSLIQARELKRLAPDDTIPADLVEAMESLRAALDQHSLTKNEGGGV